MSIQLNEKSATVAASKGWETVKLNDSTSIPEIGFGSWRGGNDQQEIDQVETALEVGFDHIDTAQIYGNESEVGTAIDEFGLPRKELYVTTKWSGKDGKGITESIHDSLKNLKLKSVNLYLIHSPRLVAGKPIECWTEFEKLKEQGLTKSIGVSNYKIADLEVLRLAGLTTPAVNQILLHPYVYAETKDLLAYHKEHNIVTEAYSTLIPITAKPGGPLDPVLKVISVKYNVAFAAILLTWARSKGAVVLTSSRQKDRLQDYISAGELELTEAEIKSIDVAGAIKFWKFEWTAVQFLRLVLVLVAFFLLSKMRFE